MLRIWNRSEAQPKFCTYCGKHLENFDLEDGYNAYTGKPKMKAYIGCTTARKTLVKSPHDVWEVYDDIIEPIVFGLQTIAGE